MDSDYKSKRIQELNNVTRKDLQNIAKENNIRANQKSKYLIEQIIESEISSSENNINQSNHTSSTNLLQSFFTSPTAAKTKPKRRKSSISNFTLKQQVNCSEKKLSPLQECFTKITNKLKRKSMLSTSTSAANVNPSTGFKYNSRYSMPATPTRKTTDNSDEERKMQEMLDQVMHVMTELNDETGSTFADVVRYMTEQKMYSGLTKLGLENKVHAVIKKAIGLKKIKALPRSNNQPMRFLLVGHQYQPKKQSPVKTRRPSKRSIEGMSERTGDVGEAIKFINAAIRKAMIKERSRRKDTSIGMITKFNNMSLSSKHTGTGIPTVIEEEPNSDDAFNANLPEEWLLKQSRTKQEKYYYYNTKTKETVWDVEEFKTRF